MIPIRVRRMTPDDVEFVMTISQGLDYAPHWPRSAYLTALDPGAPLRRRAWVAEDEAAGIVAFALVSVLPPQAELEIIAVVPDRQRQGLARRLLTDLLADLEIFGITEVMLEVRASNEAARAFYSALGFVQRAMRPGYYADPVEDAVLLSLPIAPSSGSARGQSRTAL